MCFQRGFFSVVHSIINYFLSKFGHAHGSHGQIDGCDFEAFMKIIRAADIFNPWVAVTVEAAKAMEYLEDLTLIRVATAEMVRKLKDEWGNLVLKAGGSEEKDDTLAFYKEHNSGEGGLQMFAEVAQILAVLPTSSAACERVFSLLRLMFGKRQDSSLEDYLKTTSKLQ